MIEGLKILTLNCQKGYQLTLNGFLKKVINSNRYDFILLQEANEDILELVNSFSSGYSIVSMFNERSCKLSQLAIIYRTQFKLHESKLLTFEKYLDKERIDRPEFGILIGQFSINNLGVIIGTLHTSSGINYKRRIEEIKFCKKSLLYYISCKYPVFFGGDFNSVFPWESLSYNKFFLPSFLNCTSDSGSTFNSFYVEPVNLLNLFSSIVGKLGFNLQLKIDHIYADLNSSVLYSISCRVVKERVSDHYPLEVVVSKKE